MVKESQNLAALFGPEYKGVFDGVTGDISEAAAPQEKMVTGETKIFPGRKQNNNLVIISSKSPAEKVKLFKEKGHTIMFIDDPSLDEKFLTQVMLDDKGEGIVLTNVRNGTVAVNGSVCEITTDIEDAKSLPLIDQDVITIGGVPLQLRVNMKGKGKRRLVELAPEGLGSAAEAPQFPEAKKPKINWDFQFKKAFLQMGESFGQNFKELWQKKNSKTWPQQALTILSAGISEIPGWGQMSGLLLLTIGSGMMTAKEIVKFSKLVKGQGRAGIENYAERSALVQSVVAITNVIFGIGGERAGGIRETGKELNKTEELLLTNKEAALAGVIGGIGAAISLLLLTDFSPLNVIPGMKFGRRLFVPLVTASIAHSFTVLGASYYDGLIKKDSSQNETIEKRKEQFVDLCLRVNGPAMQLVTLANLAIGTIESGALEKFSESVKNLFKRDAVAVTSTPTPTETAIPTSTSEEGTLAASLTPTLTATLQAATATGTPPPTETPPSAMPDWQPGQTVDSNLLQKVFNSGGRYDSIQVNIDNDAEPEQVFRFNLDSDTQPEVWAVKDNQGVWHPWIWEDKGGLYKADLNLDGQIDQGALSYKDLEDNHLLLSWQGAGEERGPLNLEMKDYDLDDDGDNDLLNDADGWYLDRNKNFAFGEGDVRLSEDPVFNSAGNVTKLEAVDGQKWWRGVDGKMIGLVFQDNCWWLDHGGYELDEANPLATTAFTSGGIEVKAANINNFSLESGDSEAFRLVLKDAVIQFHGDKGQWQYDSNGNLVKEGCLLANDQTLAFDRRIEGQGIMAWQYQLALNHPDWTPDEVAKAAFLHQSEPINLNLSRPEPYRAPSGSLTFDQLAMGPRGGDEGIIMHDVHEVNGNLNATQVAQAAHIAVVNNNISGSAMISDVNTTIARFNLESTFGQIMKENGIRDEWVSNYARQAAFTAIKDRIGWQIPGDKIFSGALDNNSLQIFSTHDYSWWEDWLRQNGYIS